MSTVLHVSVPDCHRRWRLDGDERGMGGSSLRGVGRVDGGSFGCDERDGDMMLV